MTLALGQKFVNITELYDIGEFLGGGGFGKAYKAVPKRGAPTDCAAAIKILLQKLKDNKDEATFFNEIFILNSIRSRSVHRLLFAMRSPPANIPPEWQKIKYIENKIEKTKTLSECGPIIVTEYMPNGDARKIINEYIELAESPQRDQNRFIEVTTLLMKIIYGTAEGMAVLHSKNIIHSDLKPENVFLNDKIEPVVADFGISTKTDMGPVDPNRCSPLFYFPDTPRSFPYDVFSYSIFLLVCFCPIEKLYLADGDPLAAKCKKFSSPCFFKWGEYLKNDNHRCQKPDLMPEPLYNLAKRCWRTNPDERLTFVEIVDILKDPSMWIPGTDPAKMIQYIYSPEAYLNPERLSEPSEGKISIPKPIYIAQ